MRAILDDRARLQRMLDFEVALARAQAALGVVPALAIDPIAKAAHAERYDIEALGEAAVAAGNVAIPLIKALTAEVAKTDARPPATCIGAPPARTSSTPRWCSNCARRSMRWSPISTAPSRPSPALAGRHRRTPRSARTWMQHAVPMPFGLKLAGYAAALARSRERLRGCARRRWCCNSAAPPARSPRSATAASTWPSGSPPCSICRCPTRPGTATATGWPKSHRRLRSSPAPAARSRATSRC